MIIWFVNIGAPWVGLGVYALLVKLSFLWETYVAIVRGYNTLHRCDYLEKT